MKPFFERFSGSGYICAHRGARSIAPENTFLAIEKAYLSGAHLYETDVQATADGELILFHDHTLERTTDISIQPAFSARSPWSLAEFTYAELQTLDAGSWFIETDPFGTIKSKDVRKKDFRSIQRQRIPLLQEALIYCHNHNFPLNLEIKDQTGTAADTTIVAQVIELIKATQTESLILISSFNHSYLRQLKELNLTIATAALVEETHPESLLFYLRDLGVDAYHPDQLITDAALVQELTKNGIRVNLWTVNDPAKAQYFIEAGATFICTDWPQRLLPTGQS